MSRACPCWRRRRALRGGRGPGALVDHQIEGSAEQTEPADPPSEDTLAPSSIASDAAATVIPITRKVSRSTYPSMARVSLISPGEDWPATAARPLLMDAKSIIQTSVMAVPAQNIVDRTCASLSARRRIGYSPAPKVKIATPNSKNRNWLTN